MIRLIAAIGTALAACTAWAEDWPTFQHDNHRSGVTSESLTGPLTEAWRYVSPGLPQTAWEGPAKWDAYSGRKNLKSMRNFDPAFYVTSVGNHVYFGSSVEDAAIALDAATGNEAWIYFADAPVRIPPTIDSGRAYFGSDDGRVYCVSADTGKLAWDYLVDPDARHVPAKGKMISLSPVRTGVLVDNGVAYFGASLLPWRDSFVCAVDAQSGSADGRDFYVKKIGGLMLQGALLASNDNLYVLQGRAAPVILNRATGTRRGTVQAAGGAYALLTEDAQLVASAPSQKADFVSLSERESRDQLATFEGANRMLVAQGVAYLQSASELSAFDRARYLRLQVQINDLRPEQAKLEEELKEKDFDIFSADGKAKAERLKAVKQELETLTGNLPECFLWRVPAEAAHALILAGDTLWTGGDGRVAAVSAESGETVWSTSVDGIAHGLAVANGRLFVSTDRGAIHCFTRSQAV